MYVGHACTLYNVHVCTTCTAVLSSVPYIVQCTRVYRCTIIHTVHCTMYMCVPRVPLYYNPYRTLYNVHVCTACTAVLSSVPYIVQCTCVYRVYRCTIIPTVHCTMYMCVPRVPLYYHPYRTLFGFIKPFTTFYKHYTEQSLTITSTS